MTYLILQHPGHNRVYYDSSDKLARAELNLAIEKLSIPCSSAEIIEIEGIRYLSFSTQKVLTESDLKIISRLSFLFALFQKDELKGNVVLIPKAKLEYEYLDSKISTLLKYQGKTNELFTKMMVNVALLTSNFNYSDKIELLDPVSGKGTTLFEAAVYGLNAFGIEIETKFANESALFFKKYLEDERLKHEFKKRQIFGNNKSEAVFIAEFDYARSKSEFKLADERKKLGVVLGNARDAFKYFKKERFHLIVGDLPYGIFHGNRAEKKSNSATRNPSELLEICVVEWFKVLKKGGVVVLAWNSFVASPKRLAAVFEDAGFQVQKDTPFNEFEHRVDKSIKRDIIVAKKI